MTRIHVEPAFMAISGEEEAYAFLGRVENARLPLLQHCMSFTGDEQEEQLVRDLIAADISGWTGLAWAKVPTPATKPSSGVAMTASGFPADRQFPNRAAWLGDRLLERGWSNLDVAQFGGPDRKTVEKILRGDAVRNDVLVKLADSLSGHVGAVNVLDIPRD